jgi:hypothetical protein
MNNIVEPNHIPAYNLLHLEPTHTIQDFTSKHLSWPTEDLREEATSIT